MADDDLLQAQPASAESGDAWETGLGVGLTLLSQAILAGRLVAEESVLTESSLHPMQVRCLCGVCSACV